MAVSLKMRKFYMLGLEWNLHLCYFICEDISILNHLILLGFFF